MTRVGVVVALLVAIVSGALAQAPRHRPPARPPANPPWTARTWDLFTARVTRAHRERLDTLPIGRAVVALGRTFVGAAYVPGTLEVPGPERVVVNLRAFDCVTFVEQVIALAWFVKLEPPDILRDRRRAEARYAHYLQQLRYRDGVLDGYPSRLHYFSEWLADHERRGVLRVLGDELGAAADARPVDFMSTHVRAYRQLADPAALEAIRAVEARLTAGPPRRYVPAAEVRAIEGRLRDGDVLAMTSALPGLDVAHTGFAVIEDGRAYLLNAPLVGKTVELAPLPLAEHLARRPTQTGVMVGRLAEPPLHAHDRRN